MLDGYCVAVLDCEGPLGAAVADGLEGEGATALRVGWPAGDPLDDLPRHLAGAGRLDAVVVARPADLDASHPPPADGTAALDEVFATCRAVGEQFARQRHGQLVHLVTDQAYGDVERPDLAAYHAAYLSLAQSLGVEWAGFLDAVNTVVLRRPLDAPTQWNAASAVAGLLSLNVTGQVLSVTAGRLGGRAVRP